MKVYVLDGEKMTSITEAHRYIAKTLDFPDYYGGNLDALYDCLSGIPKSGCIVVINKNELTKYLGGYARRLITVIDDASNRYGFSFAVCEDGGNLG